MSQAFLGGELDWFAVDELGAIALFATDGQGFVPDCVQEFRVMHETVSNSIEYPNWGSAAIWDDAAVLGLYVFDWQVPAGRYVLAATPTNEIDAQIRLMVSRITDLPKCARNFSTLKQVTDVNDFAPIA